MVLWGERQSSKVVFPLLFLRTNFISFTTEPEDNSETQGQDLSVSCSYLFTVFPPFSASPVRGVGTHGKACGIRTPRASERSDAAGATPSFMLVLNLHTHGPHWGRHSPAEQRGSPGSQTATSARPAASCAEPSCGHCPGTLRSKETGLAFR